MSAPKSLRARALDLLSRGEQSQQQLRRKLAKYSSDEAEIDALVDDLTARGWQSDARYAEVLVHSKAERLGNRRLRQQLHQHGITDDLFNQLLPSRSEQLAAASTILQKKFKTPSTDRAMRVKYLRFLTYRGFEMDISHDAIAAWQNQHED